MKTIIPGFSRCYNSAADRKRAIATFRRHGWNYFICFKDVSGEYALTWGFAWWVLKDQLMSWVKGWSKQPSEHVYVDW